MLSPPAVSELLLLVRCEVKNVQYARVPLIGKECKLGLGEILKF